MQTYSQTSKPQGDKSREIKNVILSLVLCFMSSVNEQILDAFRAHIQDINQRFVNHRKTAPQILKVRTIDTKAKAKAKGQDLIHNECGAWTLVRVGQQLQLQSGEDFRSSPGPDRHVYMSNGLAMKDNDELSSRPIN